MCCLQNADPTCNVYLRLIPVEEGKYCVLQTIRHPNLSIPAPVDTGIHPHMISFVHLGIRLGAEPIRILHGLRCACVLLLRLQCGPACLHCIHMTCISLLATQSNGQWVARHPSLLPPDNVATKSLQRSRPGAVAEALQRAELLRPEAETIG